MTEPWNWTEKEINALIRANEPESLTLDYKAAAALDSTDGKKNEISKDVSAMANSAGGTLIYGIGEDKEERTIRLDAVDATPGGVEWLEQVISSNIKRRIPGVRVHCVAMLDSGLNKAVYVVAVPSSTFAPHMAADHRFYKRIGTITTPMEEYEVRDVARRSESPDLRLDFKWINDPNNPNNQNKQIFVTPHLTNLNPEPAFYATCRLFIENLSGWDIQQSPMSADWVPTDQVQLLCNEDEKRLFNAFQLFWSAPERRTPLLEGESYPVGRFSLDVSDVTRDKAVYTAYEIRSPKMPTTIVGSYVTFHLIGDGTTVTPFPVRRME